MPQENKAHSKPTQATLASRLFIFKRLRWSGKVKGSLAKYSPKNLMPPFVMIGVNSVSQPCPLLGLHLLLAGHLLGPVTRPHLIGLSIGQGSRCQDATTRWTEFLLCRLWFRCSRIQVNLSSPGPSPAWRSPPPQGTVYAS